MKISENDSIHTILRRLPPRTWISYRLNGSDQVTRAGLLLVAIKDHLVLQGDIEERIDLVRIDSIATMRFRA